MTTLEYLTEELERLTKFIRDKSGIELTWAEKAGLRTYIDKFNEQTSLGTGKGGIDAIHYFMSDYFDIDWIMMGTTPVCLGKGIENNAWIDFGMDFLGTPELKEYCRRRVQQWRDERELI